MNKDILQGEWKEVKGAVKSWWGNLTNDEVEETAGEQVKFEGLLQKKFGKSKEEAIKEVNDFLKTNHAIKGNAKIAEGYFKNKWGSLTGSDVTQIKGTLESVAGYAQKYVGVEGEKLRKEIVEAIKSTDFEDYKKTFGDN